MGTVSPFSAAHLVGEPFDVVQHYHTYVLRCRCEAQTVSVIIGDGAGVTCPGCGGTPAARIEGAKVVLGFQRAGSQLVQ